MDKIKPQQKILLTYLMLIIIGSILLILPFSYKGSVNYLNMLFISTSAVTITGLETISVFNTFTVFGKFVLAILIQLGGLSITTIQVFILTIVGAKISYRDRDLVKENINVNSREGIIKTIKRIIIISSIIEFVGVLLLFPFFMIKGYTFLNSLGHSLFHTISSFNNAGFSILGKNSLMIFENNIYFNIITILLIVFGGIGTLVIYDLVKNRRLSKLSYHTKIVLKMTLILFLFSTIAYYIIEDSPTIMNSLFHSATIRTAGFYTTNYKTVKSATLFITIIFMFIGGAPASTAGGIKVTTLFTLIKSSKSKLLNKDPVSSKRKIPKEYIDKAYLILSLSLFVVLIGTFTLLVVEDISLTDSLFEVVSAYSNTGLTLNLTTSLKVVSKLLLIMLMIIGRVGVIAFFVSFTYSNNRYSNVDYIDIDYLI